jgi:hypothetical protein
MRKRFVITALAASLAGCLLAAAAYSLPPVHSRLSWRLESLLTEVRYVFNPPEQVVFVPQGLAERSSATNSGPALATMDAIVQATIGALPPTATQPPPATPTSPGPTATSVPSPMPTFTPAPLPSAPLPPKAILGGVRHEFQQMNNCGPTTLAMALSFWGWQGDQRDTRAYLRPNFQQVDDKNVMPAELVDYVQTQTNLKALTRVGGDLDLLKRFIAAGFPVVIEKGLQPHPGDWMGHYALVTGYDDGKQRFITQDSYTGPGVDVKVPYEQVGSHWWRDFNYVYVVVYPAERQGEVLAILGPQADENANYRYAADKARQEIASLSGRDLYFAWYNLGSNLVALQDYSAAAEAYDQAFALYPAIPEADRPWRILWYQTGPYAAYYYTGRYQDVISLGNQTLNLVGKPILEETLFWMGIARQARGEMDKAILDYRRAAEINPRSTPALEQLNLLGVAFP